jgi:hypothetical protein
MTFNDHATLCRRLQAELDVDIKRLVHAQRVHQFALDLRASPGTDCPPCDELATVTSHYKTYTSETYLNHLRVFTDFILLGEHSLETRPLAVRVNRKRL